MSEWHRPKRLVVLIALLAIGTALGILAQAPEAAAQQSSAVVSSVTGQVRVMPAGQNAFVPLQVGMRVTQGADIVAGAGSRAELRLPDGSTLLLVENSRFVVNKLDYDAQNRMRSAFFHLAVGKLRGFVAKAATTLAAARGGNFAITTPTAVAAVRGTELYVQVGADGSTTFFVTGGVATIKIGNSIVTLQPGQTVRLTQAGAIQGATATGTTTVGGQTVQTFAGAPADQATVNAITSAANPATAGVNTVTQPQTVKVSYPDAAAVTVDVTTAVTGAQQITVTPVVAPAAEGVIPPPPPAPTIINISPSAP
jgi:hypothetical protein